MDEPISPQVPSILRRIVQAKRLRLEQARWKQPLGELKAMIADLPQAPKERSFAQAVRADRGVRVIGELKRSSPSAGLIRREFNLAELQRSYEAGGIDAYSVLTEEDFFRGSLEDLRTLRSLTKKPILRKDFLFDPYQIYESREHGADAVLLITTLLEAPRLRELLALCAELGMEALVEIHSLKELEKALEAGAGILGINNRNLHTFDVRLEVSLELSPHVPPHIPVVSESGIRSAQDLRSLAAAGIRAFLIGEYFMRSPDIAAAVRELKEAL